MLSLSTAFISAGNADGRLLVEALAKYNIHGIELDCRLNRAQFQQIKACIGSTRLRVSSLHNYCPFPAIKPHTPPGGDYFKLSSPDLEERRSAVKWTTRTIENANDLQAGAVVLHCGAIEMDSRHLDVYRMFRQGLGESQIYRDLLATDLQIREQRKAPHMDALLFSLDRLLPLAAKHGVTLGLQNRYHYFQLPDRAELDLILNEFKGAPVGYWHDTGHAHVFESLGIISQQALLDAFTQQLAGIHVHDALGLNDHLAPGTGDIDFTPLRPYLKEGCPVVIELAPGTPPGEVQDAVTHLRAMGEFSETAEASDFFS
jgi:sugar phosphate isomerase/epimerase